jgi:hypothetical protein
LLRLRSVKGMGCWFGGQRYLKLVIYQCTGVPMYRCTNTSGALKKSAQILVIRGQRTTLSSQIASAPRDNSA